MAAKRKFKVGDKVLVDPWAFGHQHRNEVGTVTVVNNYDVDVILKSGATLYGSISSFKHYDEPWDVFIKLISK